MENKTPEPAKHAASNAPPWSRRKKITLAVLLIATIAIAIQPRVAASTVRDIVAVPMSYVIGFLIAQANHSTEEKFRKKGRDNYLRYEKKMNELKAKGDPWGDYMQAKLIENNRATANGIEELKEIDKQVIAIYKALADKGMREGKINWAIMNLRNTNPEVAKKAFNNLKEEAEKASYLLAPIATGDDGCYKQYGFDLFVEIAFYYEGLRNKSPEENQKFTKIAESWRKKSAEADNNLEKNQPPVLGLCSPEQIDKISNPFN